ncbi:hypothetical protein BJY52DRAFT_1202962 [Lactarius psammicola]|nr:hypothetical protein BJY52DRAFT_1202962 [Lactarius psammicola]
MTSIWPTLPAILSAVYYQISPKAILSANGTWRAIEPVGNTNCKKIVLNYPSGLLFLACSSPANRRHWIPALAILEEDKFAFEDYIATYDAITGSVTRLAFPTSQGFSSHGMDVVPSVSNPEELYVGAKSVVEIFRKTLGGNTLTHVRTVEDPVIDTPNDVVGSPDGKSFYITNDRCELGFARWLGLLGNGIARSPNGTIYVGSSKMGRLSTFEEQSDHSLGLTDIISTDRLLDNLSISGDGALWAAVIPSILRSLSALSDSTKVVPSSALRIIENVGESAFFGEKLQVEKVFEDDGTMASRTTSVVHDARRNTLFLSGIYSTRLTVCKTL